MYTFHRTSKKKKKSSKAKHRFLLRHGSLSPQYKGWKKNIQQTEKNPATFIFLVLSETALAVQVLGRWWRAEVNDTKSGAKAALSSISVCRCQTSCPPSWAAGRIQYPCRLREGRWMEEEFTVPEHHRAPNPKGSLFSKSLHIQWPSCLQSLLRCTCRLLKCHSSRQMRIPSTV